MAAATALALSSSVARQLSRSASTIITREVSGSHELTIDGYTASRKLISQLPQLWWATSQPFQAAGYTWQIRYLPSGRKEEDGEDDGISLYLELVYGLHGRHYHTHNHPVPVQFKFSLLDLAGNPVPGYSRSREECVFWLGHPSSTNAAIGFDDFVKWKDLHESGALNDDRFTIRCDITAIKDWTEPANGGAPVCRAPVSTVVLPPSDLHQQLSDLLWKEKHGADVAIDVAGETFDAHGWLLAARSPVFEAEMQALTVTTGKKEKDKEKETGAIARRVMKIKDMEPKVFKAMLHFMYTDALPQDVQDDDDDMEMTQGLLAAAHRYKLERLKTMCEEMLCRRIDVGTVAAILVAAQEHNCQALKAACMEFMARPGCMKAVMEIVLEYDPNYIGSCGDAWRSTVGLYLSPINTSCKPHGKS